MTFSRSLLALILGQIFLHSCMTALHRLTPPPRHGEALALRSMTINGASTLMPLSFGLLGTALGVTPLFWLMAAAMAAGSLAARQVGRALVPAEPAAIRT